MKRKLVARVTRLALLLALGLTGCTRTVDDVALWKTQTNHKKLIKALSDPNAEIRIAATEALGELKAEPAVDHLAALFNDSEEAVILAAVNALAAIGSKSTTTPLIAALRFDYPTVRSIAAVTLGEMKATGAVQLLGDALDDSEESVQRAAIVSLGQIGEEKGSEALVSKLGSTSGDLRILCIKSLGMTGGEAAAKGLIGILADNNTDVKNAAFSSLVQLGTNATPFVLEALKDDSPEIRITSLALLKELEAIPIPGVNVIWYDLARASIDHPGEVDLALVLKFTEMGDDAVDLLLEAAAHNLSDFREHASLTLERVGKSCIAKARNAVRAKANSDAKAWFNHQVTSKAPPSWHLELWSAVAALNPDFNLNKATDAFSLLRSPSFKPTRATIPLLINLLGETNQQIAIETLAATPSLSTFPLIAALENENELIAGHAAQILSEQGEKRALNPLMNVVAKKIKEGEPLTASPFYAALQEMDEPDAEPLLLKIRPNSTRAMRMFERTYPDVRPLKAEIQNFISDPALPITFRLDYINNGNRGELLITFAKDDANNWKPSPPFPDQLSEDEYSVRLKQADFQPRMNTDKR